MDAERRSRMLVTVAGWIVIFGALFAWQGLGMALGPPWLTISDMLRAFMRPLVGRWVLFALWLWVGWHLFIRGWEFFLQRRA
ncbi:MAG TPA: DUF6186 family protein [Actinomycetota bacterium]